MNKQIQELLIQKREYEKELKTILYIGTVEIKNHNNNKYLYLRKREHGKVSSIYIGIYSIELYNSLLEMQIKAKSIKKEIQKIDKELTRNGYENNDVSYNVLLNIDYARREMKKSIYDQAILEGINTTYTDTSAIIDNGLINNMTSEDVYKIINLKHAWEFIMENDIITSSTDFYILSTINQLVNQGIYYNGGIVRRIPIRITGTKYEPPLLFEDIIKDDINKIINTNQEVIDKAISLALYVMKKQIFIDGNKRTAILFANHFLISNAGGLLVVPYDHIKKFQIKLISYYESENNEIRVFLKNNCWQRIYY